MATTAEIRLVLEAQDKASSVLGHVQRALTNIGNAPVAAMAKVTTATTAATKAASGFGAALGQIGATAAGVAIGGGLAALPGALLGFAQGAADDEAATARLSQTIRNLGGDYDEIVGKVNQAISAGQRLAYSDDDVRDSFNYLATATGDADEALRRQKLAMDVARGANIPLAQATKMLGKMNEENVETFRKLGIVIGENATEAEALAAIQAKFAGQSEAYANSTAGQFEQAKIAMAEIGESIGAALLPVLAAVGRVLSENLPAIQEFIGTLSSGIADNVTPVIESLAPLFQRTFGALLPIIQPVLDILPDIGRAVAQAAAFMATGSGDIEVFRGVLNRLLGQEGAQAVIEIFTNLVGFFRSTVMPLWSNLAGAAQQALGGDLAGALTSALTALGTFGAGLVESLTVWARRFVEWVAPLIPPLLAELGRLALEIGTWLVTVAAPAIAAKLLEWGKAFVAWVVPMIPPLLAELARLQGVIIAWIATEAAPAIDRQLVAWVNAFLDWITREVLPQLPGRLAAIAAAIRQWAIDQGPGILEATRLIGVAIIDGIVAGAQGVAGVLAARLGGVVQAAVDSVKRQMLIYSPSRVTAEEIGKPLIEGVVAGMDAVKDKPKVELAKVIGEAIASLASGLNALAGLKTLPSADTITAFKATVEHLTQSLGDSAALMSEKFLAHAKLFGEAANAAVGTLGQGVTGLMALTEFQAPPASAISAFKFAIEHLVQSMADTAALMADEAIERAGQFGEAATKVVGMLGQGVAGLMALADFKPVAQASIDAFLDGALYVVARLGATAATLSNEGIQQTSAFSDAASKALGAAKLGVDAFIGMGKLNVPSKEAIDALAEGIRYVVIKLAETAARLGQDGLEQTIEFVEASLTMFQMINEALKAFSALAKTRNIPMEQIDALLAAIEQTIGRLKKMVADAKHILDLAREYRDTMREAARMVEQGNSLRREAQAGGGGAAGGGAEGRAAGGPVAAGRAYIVGEAGPELFVPGRSGLIVPAGQTAGATAVGQSSVNVYVTVQGSVTSEQELTAAIYNGLLARSRRNGGLSFEPVAF